MRPTFLSTFDDAQLLAKQEKFAVFRLIGHSADSCQIQDEHPHE
jgi:hypothetical protein